MSGVAALSPKLKSCKSCDHQERKKVYAIAVLSLTNVFCSVFQIVFKSWLLFNGFQNWNKKPQRPQLTETFTLLLGVAVTCLHFEVKAFVKSQFWFFVVLGSVHSGLILYGDIFHITVALKVAYALICSNFGNFPVLFRTDSPTPEQRNNCYLTT